MAQTLYIPSLQAVAATGNTSGTLATVSNGTLILSGGNNITLSQDGQTIAIVGGAGGPAGAFTGGMSDLGNSAGTTGVVQSQFLVVGGLGIIGSQSINGQSATLSLVNSWSTATTVNSIASANAVWANAGRFALEGHVHAGINQVSLAGNTAGATTAGAGSVVFAGGNNVTLNAATAAGGMTVSVVGPNTSAVPVVSNAIQGVNTATGPGTNTSRFAADDHVHQGLFGVDVNGVASTFVGTYQLSAGALMSLATGGNTTRGSAQIINLLSSGTGATQVSNANAAGAMVSRFANEGHVHAGVAAMAAGSNTGNTVGNTGSQFGTWVVAGTNNITVSGSTGAAGIHTMWLSAPNVGAGGGYSAGMSNIGNTSGTSGTVGSQLVFAGGNNITLSQSVNGASATITISAAAGGAAGTNARFLMHPQGMHHSGTVALTGSFSTIFLSPVRVDANLSFSAVWAPVSITNNVCSAVANTSYRGTISHGHAFYSYSTNGTLSLHTSASSTHTFSYISNTGEFSSVTGNRFLTYAFNGTLSEGDWWMGYSWSSSGARSGAANSATTIPVVHHQGYSSQPGVVYGHIQAATNSTVKPLPYYGILAQSAAFPATVSDGNVSYGTAARQIIAYFKGL